jgi:hypothetical protein
MNARKPPTTYSAIKKEVAAELERQEPELFAKHAEMLIPQAIATFLWTMALCYGWKEKRLKQLVENLKETDYLMDNPSRLHHRFSPLDCEKEIKEKYGIDVREEFPVRIEIQK